MAGAPLLCAMRGMRRVRHRRRLSGPKAAKWTRKAIIGKSRRPSTPEDWKLARAVWENTRDEAEKGWIDGPYTEEEIIKLLGPLFAVCHRFGILQGDKVRTIDDLTENLVNACFGADEKIGLGGIDEYVVLAKAILAMVHDDRRLYTVLSDGTVLAGFLHESYTIQEARELVGRTLDLEAA